MVKHKRITRKDGSFRYAELPKRQHDALVREYWKTWLAARKVRVKSEQDMDNFIARMERRLMESMFDGSLYAHDGMVVPPLW